MATNDKNYTEIHENGLSLPTEIIPCNEFQYVKENVLSSHPLEYGVSVENIDNGDSGKVTIDNYENIMYCYVNFASRCDAAGVDVQFNWLNVEAEYDGDYDYYDQFWGLEKTGCDDTVHFEWTGSNGKSMQTKGQCGCLGGYDHPTCEHGRE